MIHVTLFSADSANFRVDLDPMKDNSSLFITATDQRVEHELRVFLTLDQLRTLRDLLNEKLPPEKPAAQPPGFYTAGAV